MKAGEGVGACSIGALCTTGLGAHCTAGLGAHCTESLGVLRFQLTLLAIAGRKHEEKTKRRDARGLGSCCR